MDQPLYQCLAKALVAEGAQLRHGPNWMFARRARLKVFPDRLECGDWTITCREISAAVLYSIRQSLIIPGYVLKIETAEKVYHFGLNRSSFWAGDLPFPVEREKARLAYSPVSIVIRLVALVALAHLVWKHFLK